MKDNTDEARASAAPSCSLSTGEPRDLTFYRARIHSVLLAQEEHRLLRSSARALFRQSSSASGCFPLHRAIPVFDSNVKHLSSERAHIAPPRCALRTLHPTSREVDKLNSAAQGNLACVIIIIGFKVSFQCVIPRFPPLTRRSLHFITFRV